MAKNPDLEFEKEDLVIYNRATKRRLKLPTNQAQKGIPSFSPDGKFIAFTSNGNPKEWYKNEQVWIVATNGKSAATSLTESYDLTFYDITLNDMAGTPLPQAPQWSSDGSTLYVLGGENGSNYIYGLKIQDKGLERVWNLEGSASNFYFFEDNEEIIAIHNDLDQPGQISFKNSKGEYKELTKVNNSFFNKKDTGEIEEVWFKGGSDNDLQGWILHPPGFDKRKKYPSILQIHGGPLMQYGSSFMHEFQYLAAQGYVVYFCNPRGGLGYGEKHAKAIWGAWGTHDYDDLMAFTDFVSKRRYIDKKKMGLTGGSYGGYMTNWIICHTNRFKAAVTQRCVSNLISMWGTSDGNVHFQKPFGGKPPYEDVESYWKMSPIKYVGAAKTPTLVIHSEQDLRCPIEQGEQFYVALKSQGIDSELVLYPDESHGLSRGGRIDRRISRLQHISRWFNKYLA